MDVPNISGNGLSGSRLRTFSVWPGQQRHFELGLFEEPSDDPQEAGPDAGGADAGQDEAEETRSREGGDEDQRKEGPLILDVVA